MNQMKRGVKAAEVLDAKMPRCEDAKSVSEKVTKLLRHYGTKIVSGIKDDRSQYDKKSETEIVAISRHSEGNNNFLPKNLVITNTDVYPSKTLSKNVTFSHLFLGRVLIEGRLMLQEVAHDNNFNSSETDHASMPLRIFASKSVSNLIQLQGKKNSLTETNLFTHSPIHLFTLKRVAFTLAEVLITLGIIGVVAALTLPTVIQNYRKQETVAQLQKTYSTVNQALLQSIAENGDYINFDNANDDIGDEAFFKKYWLPYFKGATICNEQNRCGYVERGLLPSTFYCLNGILANGAGVSGNPLYITAIHYGRSTIMLPDGSVVIYFNGYGDNNQERLNTSWVLIDVNGGKEPNTYGKDVFFFDRNEKGAIVPRCKNLTTEQVNSDCSKTGTGECCAQKIINDGWKINY